MVRILFYLLIIFLLGLGFAWLAERPGEMVLTFAGYRYEVSLMVAAVAVVAVVAAVMIVWWLIRSIWNSPYAVARYFRVRRRDRGYQALSTGMVAAGAGDGGLARRMGKQAAKLVSSDQEPLIHLLDAQAALLEGDRDAAREKFTAMLDDPEMRLLGLRGLYLEAERLGDRAAARHYAAEAADTAPQLAWAADATLEARAEEGDWDGALKLLDAQKPTRQFDREALTRRRAVVLTAQAMERADSDPAAARAAAIEANRLQPDFVPAAVTAAKALFRLDELRRGSKILEAVWKKEPHPEVADVYVHARPGDAAQDRLARARKLRSLRANNAESELALARAALDAGEYGQAREAAEAAIRLAPRESAYLLMADIEEAETGDQGRVRHWLTAAVRAPADPAWVADGYVSERWGPYSPVTGRFDAFEWRTPMERLGQIVEGEKDIDSAPALAAPSRQEPDVVEGEPLIVDAEKTEAVETADNVAAESVPAEPEETGNGAAREQAEAADEAETPPPAPADKKAHGEAQREEAPEKTRVPRPPDDPGIDPDDESETATRRFRLF